MKTASNLNSSVWLDLGRGLAALAVFLGHLRSIFLADAVELEGMSAGVKVLYALTALGHPAVLFFFALSGFLVGSVVIRDVAENRWSWKRYAIQRMSRLWVVVLPALVLTAVSDKIGDCFFDPAIYENRSPSSAARFSLSETGSPSVFFANAVFLQTILTPTFGSNGPLWSLCNEFWYYGLFPFLWLATVPGRSIWLRILYAGIVLGFLFLVPQLFVGFLIWVGGAALRLIPPLPILPKGRWPFGIAIGFGIALVSLAIGLARNTSNSIAGDLIIGGVFVVLIYIILHADAAVAKGWVTHRIQGFANWSFSLYAFHFPILVLAYSAVLGIGRWLPNGTGLTSTSGIGIATLAICWTVSRMTERHTTRVRNWFQFRFGVN